MKTVKQYENELIEESKAYRLAVDNLDSHIAFIKDLKREGVSERDKNETLKTLEEIRVVYSFHHGSRVMEIIKKIKELN